MVAFNAFSVPEDQSGALGAGRWLLAIDTSSDSAGVALFDGVQPYLHQWPCVRQQTTQVLPVLHSLLEMARLDVEDLGGVAVASGPGSFTGLRVGMSVAKGLSLGNGWPLVGVPTLVATALPWTRIGASVIAVLPAGRGRLVWQKFDRELQADTPHNSTVPELVDVVGDTKIDAIVGELTPMLREGLRDVPVPVISAPEVPIRVGAVASLGWQRLIRGDHDDLATLEPVYVHGARQAAQAIVDPRP